MRSVFPLKLSFGLWCERRDCNAAAVLLSMLVFWCVLNLMLIYGFALSEYIRKSEKRPRSARWRNILRPTRVDIRRI